VLFGFRQSYDCMWVSTYGSAGGNKFRDIESSLAKLKLRHECLAPPETFPKLHLCDTGVLPGLHKQFDHSLVEIRTK